MLDKKYIFNSSIKLLKEAALSLDNYSLLNKIEELEKDYNVEDEDVTLPLLASTLLFSEGLTDNNYLYDMVEQEVLKNNDPFNLFYNENGVLLVDKTDNNTHNSLDYIDVDNIALYDNNFKDMVWDKVLKDTMDSIHNKSFVNDYLYQMVDLDNCMYDSSYLRELDPDFNFTDTELSLIDRITAYRYDTLIENCNNIDELEFMIKNLCDSSYSTTNAIDDNNSLYTNGKLDLSKLIIRIRNGLAHNNYEEFTTDYIKIYHENNNVKDANFLVDNRFISFLVFKLLESVDKSISKLKDADKIDTSIKKNYMYLINPKKKDFLDYLKQYPTLTNREIDSIYWDVRYENIKDTGKKIDELDKLARKVIKDRLPDSYVFNYLKSFNSLSDYEIRNIIVDLDRNKEYKKIVVNRDSNDPYKEQFKWINNELIKKYNYVHSYPKVLLNMIGKSANISNYDLSNYDVFDGENIDIPFSKYKLCINTVLHLMFVGNDQDKKKNYEFADLYKYLEIHPFTIQKYNTSRDTINYMDAKVIEKNKLNDKKNIFLANLEKVKEKGNTKAEENINRAIKLLDEEINNIELDKKKYETEYYTRHLRNAIAHGNITYYPFSENGELDANIYLNDYDDNGNLEFTTRITLNNLINLVFSESYTNEILHINKKSKTKVKDKI